MTLMALMSPIPIPSVPDMVTNTLPVALAMSIAAPHEWLAVRNKTCLYYTYLCFESLMNKIPMSYAGGTINSNRYVYGFLTTFRIMKLTSVLHGSIKFVYLDFFFRTISQLNRVPVFRTPV